MDAKYKWVFTVDEVCPDCYPYDKFLRDLRQQQERPKTIMGNAIYKYVRNYFADHVRRIEIKVRNNHERQ